MDHACHPHSLEHHFNENNPDTCVKCGSEEGILVHCMWKCQEIQIFKVNIIQTLSKIVSFTLLFCPHICILDFSPDDMKLAKSNVKLVSVCILQAKYCIALQWKKSEPPTVQPING